MLARSASNLPPRPLNQICNQENWQQFQPIADLGAKLSANQRQEEGLKHCYSLFGGRGWSYKIQDISNSLAKANLSYREYICPSSFLIYKNIFLSLFILSLAFFLSVSSCSEIRFCLFLFINFLFVENYTEQKRCFDVESFVD